MREYVTAAEKTSGEPIEFRLDGRMLTAYPPGEGQVALVMARMGRHSSTQDRVAGLVDFFWELLREGDKEYVMGRLLSGEDNLEFSQIADITRDLLEEWGGRPTK